MAVLCVAPLYPLYATYQLQDRWLALLDILQNNFCSFCTLKASEINNLDYKSWPTRTEAEHRELARQWKDAASEGTRDNLYQESGVRWSELLRLPYWDPTRFLLVDSMHCFFLGMFQHHCRQVWGMNVDIADTDYPSFAQDRDRPSNEDMESAFHIFRHGKEEELRRLKVPVLRELARATNVLSFRGKARKVIADLLAYVCFLLHYCALTPNHISADPMWLVR